MTPLLGPGDPPPVETINEGGAAHLLITCDHAGRAVPRALDAPAVFSAYSRLVIDCNRAPGHKGSIPVESDGVRVPGNARIGDAEADRRRAAIFEPYHRAIESVILARLGALRPLAILAIHSFTPEMRGKKRPWHVGVLWDEDPRIARPLIDVLRADRTLVVGDNEPYSARDRRGYGLHIHAADRGLAGALIEIRQDLIADAAGQAAWAARFAGVLPGILAKAGV